MLIKQIILKKCRMWKCFILVIVSFVVLLNTFYVFYTSDTNTVSDYKIITRNVSTIQLNILFIVMNYRSMDRKMFVNYCSLDCLIRGFESASRQVYLSSYGRYELFPTILEMDVTKNIGSKRINADADYEYQYDCYDHPSIKNDAIETLRLFHPSEYQLYNNYNYRFLSLYLPKKIMKSECSWKGRANVGPLFSPEQLAYDTRMPLTSWIRASEPGSGGKRNFPVLAHEIFHNFGILHSGSDLDNDSIVENEYGDHTSIMGAPKFVRYLGSFERKILKLYSNNNDDSEEIIILDNYVTPHILTSIKLHTIFELHARYFLTGDNYIDNANNIENQIRNETAPVSYLKHIFLLHELNNFDITLKALSFERFVVSSKNGEIYSYMSSAEYYVERQGNEIYVKYGAQFIGTSRPIQILVATLQVNSGVTWTGEMGRVRVKAVNHRASSTNSSISVAAVEITIHKCITNVNEDKYTPSDSPFPTCFQSFPYISNGYDIVTESYFLNLSRENIIYLAISSVLLLILIYCIYVEIF